MFVLARNSWARYESSYTVVLAVASTVEALREHAKQFGCYPEMWKADNTCITIEESCLNGTGVCAQDCHYIEPVTVV